MGGSSCQSEKTTPSQSRVLDATAAVKMELKCLTEKEHPVSSGELLVVVHACNLSYLGGRGRRIVVQGLSWAKERPYLKNELKQKGLGLWLKW
jgi:hypothetical protein